MEISFLICSNWLSVESRNFGGEDQGKGRGVHRLGSSDELENVTEFHVLILILLCLEAMQRISL